MKPAAYVAAIMSSVGGIFFPPALPSVDQHGLASYLALVSANDSTPAKPTPADGLKVGDPCPSCDGTGSVGDGTVSVPCKRCNGTGRVQPDDPAIVSDVPADRPKASVLVRKPPVAAPAAVSASPPPAVPVVVKQAKPSPVRMSSTSWTVSGRRSYTRDYLASHLERTHGIETAGYTKEELKTMHDNIHNGYPAMGRTTAGKPTVTKRYTIRRSGGCPDGRCPTR